MDVIVLAKEPVPGRVKTRLCPPCTPTEAARLAEAALADTLAAAGGSAADRVLLALDGSPGPWCPPGVVVVPQGSGDLDRRLTRAWAATRGPALQVGMDTPQVTAAELDAAMARLLAPGTDAVLGPATDGGWWAVGLRRPHPRAFLGVPTSRPDTGERQRERLAALGLRTRMLPSHTDVDHWTDALAVASQRPDTGFAAAVRDMLAGPTVADPAESGPVDLRAGTPGRTGTDADPGVGASRGGTRGAVEATRPALVATTGEVIELAVERWRGRADCVELGLLTTVADPVLDVGCGPGRIVAALAAAGRVALGLDISPAAVAEAGHRRAPVLRRSVFEPLPGERRWGTVLLLDGNVGIGGDPLRLLLRCAELLRTGGQVVVELEPPGSPTHALTVRLHSAGGHGPWFPWARAGVDGIATLATAAGLGMAGCVARSGRWFGRLVKL